MTESNTSLENQHSSYKAMTSHTRTEEQVEKSCHSSITLPATKYFHCSNTICHHILNKCSDATPENDPSYSFPSLREEKVLSPLKHRLSQHTLVSALKDIEGPSPFPPIASFDDITQPALHLMTIVLSRIEQAYDRVTLNRKFCGHLLRFAKLIGVSIPYSNYKSTALGAMQLRTLLDRLIRDLYNVLEFLKRNRMEYLYSELVSRSHEDISEPIHHAEGVVDKILLWAIQVHKSLKNWIETWKIVIPEEQIYSIPFHPKSEKKICLHDWLKESQEKALFIEWGTKLGWMVMILNKLKKLPASKISSKQIWISGDILDPIEIEIDSTSVDDFQSFFNEAISVSRLLLEIAIGIPSKDIPDIYELPTDLSQACPDGFLNLCRSCYSTRPPTLHHLFQHVFTIAPCDPVSYDVSKSILSCRANLTLTYLPSLRKLAEHYLNQRAETIGIVWLQCAASHGDGSSAFSLLSYLHLHHEDLRSFVHYLHLGIRVGHLNSFKAWCQLHPLITYMTKNVAIQVTKDLEKCKDERYY
ncbi:hypothetical protein HMI54_007988 [Coelomomyces lativittatus]|nr:hypothetical protein HMI54_007988 [Coelomomyces lativittatus]KAJ1504064.1 hypothetical protein HMI55_002189 [Coelomomyces lativittatus]KAJ1504080.1 hypothetical protein HMI56_001803 [Coelomomyces lativittatus]